LLASGDEAWPEDRLRPWRLNLVAPSREEWEKMITAASEKRSLPLKAQTYRNKKWSSASNPVLLACSDGQEYVVKGRQNGRMVANEQIVGTLARKLGAPVPEVRLIDVSAELIALNPEMQHMQPGLGHGSLSLLPDCTERVWLDHAKLPGNRSRFALLAVLYGWIHANDHQLVYRKTPPELVFSVDHGHFFNGGPAWTPDSLNQAGRAVPDVGIVQGCQIADEELSEALKALRALNPGSISEAVATPPADWQLSIVDRVAAADYLYKRQGEILAS
jgi:hypothetical protein